MTVRDAVVKLLVHGIRSGLIEAEDSIFAANQIYDVLALEPDFDFNPAAENLDMNDETPLEEILACLLDDAVSRGRIDGGIASRDLFDTKIMGCLTPRPSDVTKKFWELYQDSPEKATDYFYKLSKDSDYIRTYRIKKDRKWPASTRYGLLDITINLSKPEKDPKAIAAALSKKDKQYPLCLLCPTNTGYAGRLDHPARQTIRLIPLKLDGADWFMQYSPYVYYNEHCIVLSGEHVPMKIDDATFRRLMDFIKLFPHYTVGSNADLPIVGGSILTHEHFQGGRYEFAMERAGIREAVTFAGFEDVTAGIVEWPMSVIRLDAADPQRVVELAGRILAAWRGYSDPQNDVFAETEGTPHNTITPIARMRGDQFELDLVLRNNRTTEEFPLGIFHPHQELHHIKKENIGLIEVMGLAVLPARLLTEMETLKKAMLEGADLRAIPEIAAHADWAEEIRERRTDLSADTIDGIIEEEIGIVFAKVLEHCGVFKDTEDGREGFRKFIESV